MARIVTTLYKSMFIFLLTATTVLSAAQRPAMSIDVLPHNIEFIPPFRDERNIDLEQNKNKQDIDDDTKFLSVIKRKHADQNRIKHPFIITKEDVENQDNIVEDNIIVESNVLKLIRPTKKATNEILRIKRSDSSQVHNRVKRGWNLQHVIVPNEYPYVVPPASTRWNVRRSKEYYDEPVKYSRYNGYKGWGTSAQELQPWRMKIYG